MKRYFSLLARRTGVRIGAGDAQIPSTPVGPARPLHVAPLEVEEIRDAAPEPAHGLDRREPPAPSREPEPRTSPAGSLPGVRRIGAPDPPQQQRPWIEEMPAMERRAGERSDDAPAREMPSGIERFETRIVQPIPEQRAQSTVPADSAAAPDFGSGRGERSAELPGVEIPGFDVSPAESRDRDAGIARAEEYVIRMIEGDRAQNPDTDSTTVRPTREGDREGVLEGVREVIEWIGSPAVQPTGESGHEEKRSIREIERMVGTIPSGRYAEVPEPRDLDRAAMRSGDDDPMRGRSAREPEVQDFTLSIGSIRVVIEEPREHAVPQQAPPPPRAEAPSRTASGDSSRLSRHYITFG